MSISQGDPVLHHVMFDVDGTLVESFKFDEECYIDAVSEALGHKLDSDWSKYPHISDAGILDHHLAQRGQLHTREDAHTKVKAAFIANIKGHLSSSSAKQVNGAAEFITHLRKQPNVSLSIATGGWGKLRD
ncbi:HAD family hydrolase [Agarivorans sp. Alg241-V36]|uniref:HAD family hydrolase n=1 Tax=Agarivorans sp. Alg241-V36 TaxID=2305992 RepID=UPI0013D5305F|nr:HAD family hydrolase [Agarivorans sp. Alg241-V36]